MPSLLPALTPRWRSGQRLIWACAVGWAWTLPAWAQVLNLPSELPPTPWKTLADEITPLPILGNPKTPENQARAAWNQDPSPLTGLPLLSMLTDAQKKTEAKALAAQLSKYFAESEQVWAQLGYFWFMMQDFKKAQHCFTQALRGTGWQPDQRRNLTEALTNSAQAAGDLTTVLDMLRPLVRSDDVQSQLRLGRTQLAMRDRRSAVATAREAAALARTAGDREDAEKLEHDALQPIEDAKGNKLLNQAYGYMRNLDDVKGLASFHRGFALGSGKAFHYADAAYAAKRLNDNHMAIALFRFALDLNAVEKTFSDQRVYGFRREIETMEREFGALIGTPYRAGALDVWQVGVEAFWQPPVIGFRDGQILRFFARTYANVRNGENGPVGGPTLQESLGVSYKPLASQNITVTAERLFAVGKESLNDWLFRLGYSTGAGTDLRVDSTNWASWQLFAEAAFYLHARRLLVGTEVRYGVIFPTPGLKALTIYPHGLIGADLDTASTSPLADTVGPGLSLRYWFREDKYRAPRAWAEVHASYRWSDAERGRGPGLRATVSF